MANPHLDIHFVNLPLRARKLAPFVAPGQKYASPVDPHARLIFNIMSTQRLADPVKDTPSTPEMAEVVGRILQATGYEIDETPVSRLIKSYAERMRRSIDSAYNSAIFGGS